MSVQYAPMYLQAIEMSSLITYIKHIFLNLQKCYVGFVLFLCFLNILYVIIFAGCIETYINKRRDTL